MSVFDPVVDWINSKFRDVMTPFYPIITDPWFVFLPIPAFYELFTHFQHSDGQQLRRVGIILVNVAVGAAAYKVGGPFPSWFNFYLFGGLAFYAIIRTLLQYPGPDKTIPDLDPCGNPITRPGGGSGGGGAC